MGVLSGLRRPATQGARLHLTTLTPLYTGGIGQQGEQLHPSGLLGSIRRFSCLLAIAVGEDSFEKAVWGDTGQAKAVALRWDTGGLKTLRLPERINWGRADQRDRKGWFYNTAHHGSLAFTLTRRAIGDRHWQLLLLALRIQLRHATLGAKDQYGLGVLAAGDLPAVAPLTTTAAPLDGPGLHRACFAEVRFESPCPAQWQERLEAGLRLREALRGAFRQEGMTELRHYLFGELNRWGSAVNVSALYPLEGGCALRVWALLPHTRPALGGMAERRGEIVQTLRTALSRFRDYESVRLPELSRWEDGGRHGADLATWINRLAGVA